MTSLRGLEELLFLGLVCDSPKTSVMSYVAADAQVLTHAPFIAQFSLTCKGKPVTDLPLYYANQADGGFVQVRTLYTPVYI